MVNVLVHSPHGIRFINNPFVSDEALHFDIFLCTAYLVLAAILNGWNGGNPLGLLQESLDRVKRVVRSPEKVKDLPEYLK